MKRITLKNYKEDRYYARIVQAVAEILDQGDVVAPVDVMVRMGLLTPESLENWRFGRVPFLESVLHCNLAKASRVLRILRFHAHDLDLRPSLTRYMRWGKGTRMALRFSKSVAPKLEEAYSRHFLSPRLKRHKPRES